MRSSDTTTPADRPALVMLVVVDQLRADLIDKYADLFHGGFRRMREEGYAFTNASQAHAATETAVGHATLATGVYPNKHGVIGNAWLEFSGGKWVTVSNVRDSTERIVGGPDNAPGASPHYSMRSGLAEWMVAANPNSIVASVSGKDRGAIQPAAHARGAYVYWFNSALERFVTSTYYRKTNPDCVNRFNATDLRRHSSDAAWNLSVPREALARASRDTVAAEADGVHTYFPHQFAAEGPPETFWQWWEATPALDAATLEFARTLIECLSIGKDPAPDFLNVSLSATDRIGHAYGPGSREQLDNLLRLDAELGEFFSFLDARIGKGRWVMMLSADHGVLDMPEDLIARGEYAHRLTQFETSALDSLRARAARNPDRGAAIAELVRELKKLDIVGDAVSIEVVEKAPADSFMVLQQRSLYPGRLNAFFGREGVIFRFVPGILRGPRGSSHGTVYWYDRHVPMIFMGAGIPHGQSPATAKTVDFAPTAAALIGIPYPDDLDGKALDAITQKR